MADITLVASTHNETTNTAFGSSNNISKPTGTASGDVIVLLFAADGSANGDTFDQPGGWTSLFTALHPTGDGQYLHGYYKVAGGSEPSAYSFQSNANGGNDVAYICSSWRNVNATTLDLTPVTTTNSSANASPVSVSLTGLTVVTNNSVALWCAAGDPNSANSGSWSMPSGYTQADAHYANFAPLAIGYKTVNAGATGNVAGTLTFTGGNAGFAGAMIVLRGDGSGGGGVAPRAQLLYRRRRSLV